MPISPPCAPSRAGASFGRADPSGACTPVDDTDASPTPGQSATTVPSPATPRPLRHLPRRERTATSVLRAIPGSEAAAAAPPPPPGAHGAPAAPTGSPASAREESAALRALSLRDLAAGGCGATLAWTLAAHLGLLGTALGTFLISVISAVAIALAGDSLRGLRRMVLRTARARRERRIHRRRRP